MVQVRELVIVVVRELVMDISLVVVMVLVRGLMVQALGLVMGIFLTVT
jgi:hypothetical protein